MNRIDWLPIFCECGRAVGVAPPDRMPALVLCTACIVGAALQKAKPRNTDADNELDLPIRTRKVRFY